MDPLAHTLVGATLAETRLARGVRLGGVALVVGANLPDVDAISLFWGRDFALGFRRGWTHGILAVALWPFLLTAALVAIDRWWRHRQARADAPQPPPVASGRLLALSAIGVVSHPLLDWLNTYGVRLLMPFDGRWFYGDALFIVDPWMWLLLGGALLLARAGRGPGWWILAGLTSLVVLGSGVTPRIAGFVWVAGLATVAVLRHASRRRAWGERAAWIGIGAVALYVTAMIGSTLWGAAWVRAELSRTGVVGVDRLMVGPRAADPFHRDVLAEVPEGYRYGTLTLGLRPRLELTARLIDRTDDAWIDAVLRARQVEGVVDWMRFPFAEIEERPDGYTVYLLDARYVRRRTEGFGGTVLFLDRTEAP